MNTGPDGTTWVRSTTTGATYSYGSGGGNSPPPPGSGPTTTSYSPPSGITPAQQRIDDNIGNGWRAGAAYAKALAKANGYVSAYVDSGNPYFTQSQIGQLNEAAAITNRIASNPVVEFVVNNVSPVLSCAQELSGDMQVGAYGGAGFWYVSQFIPGWDVALDSSMATGAVVGAATGCYGAATDKNTSPSNTNVNG
jgi:hypothetical protein